MSPCPHTETLARLAAGSRDDAETQQARTHLRGCIHCQRQLSALQLATVVQDSMGSGPTYIPQEKWDDEPTAPSGRPLGETLPLAPPADRAVRTPGTQVGRYRLLDVVGWGGAGVVYAAWDPELDRKIALKLLTLPRKLQQAEPEARARLLREAQAMARLHHPNVVTVHDVGDFEGAVFIAMEFVGGGTLRSWMKTQRTPEEILEVLRAVGRGLSAAHRAGLVHRDLKPENVLIGTDGAVKVSDFGLARAAGAVAGGAPEALPASPGAGTHDSPLLSPLTQDGAVLGTPGYMPPEQVRGGVTGPAGDQFSFCVSAYEALYGTRPFAGQTLGELTLAALRGEVRPPPANVRVPARVHQALLRGLSGQPEARFASLEALLAELSPRKGFTRRHWLALARSATVLAASLFLGAFYLSWRTSRCDGLSAGLQQVWGPEHAAQLRERFIASGLPYAESSYAAVKAALDGWADRWTAHRVEACEATLLRDEQPPEVMRLRQSCLERQRGYLEALARVWSGADPRAVEEAPAAVRSLPEPSACSAERVTASLIDEADRHPEVVHALAQGQAQLFAGAYAEGLKTAKRAVAEAEAKQAPGLWAQALLLRAHGERLLGDRPQATATYREAARAGMAAGEDKVVAEAQLHRVRLLSLAGDLEDAREVELDAEAAVARLASREDLRPELLSARGERLRSEGELEQALAAYTEALSLRRAADGPHSPATADLLVRVAVTQTRLGALVEAQRGLEEALPVVEAVFGPGHPQVARVHVDLGNVHFRLGAYEAAAKEHRRALAIYEAAVPPEHLVLAAPLGNLGNVLRHLGQTEEALQLHERALRVAEQTYGETARLPPYLGNLAESLLAQGRPEEALQHAERAVKLRRRLLPEDHPDHAASLVVYGEVLAHLGRHAPAQAALTQALDLRERKLGGHHYLVAETLERTARAHLLARRRAQAVAALERALELRRGHGLDPIRTEQTARALEEARAAGP